MRSTETSLSAPLATAALVSAALFGTGCSASSSDKVQTVDRDRIRIEATTSFLADTFREIGGRSAAARSVMEEESDPHSYRVDRSAILRLRTATLAARTGLGLEGRLTDVFVTLADGGVTTLAVAQTIPRRMLLRPRRARSEPPAEFDPHVWLDPQRWRIAARAIAGHLGRVDSDSSGEYRARLADFEMALDRLDREIRRKVATIPASRRILVTSHDAFRYFGDAYGFETVAVQGASTQDEIGKGDIERVADLVVERKVPIVFPEAGVSAETLEAVAEAARDRGHEVRISSPLYSDSTGERGSDEGTYLGMMRANLERIVEGLR